VDLIPPKTCSYDCLYCQIGKTTCKAIEPAAYVPVEAVIAELDETLAKEKPDYVTFSGSGEPTLHVNSAASSHMSRKEPQRKWLCSPMDLFCTGPR